MINLLDVTTLSSQFFKKYNDYKKKRAKEVRRRAKIKSFLLIKLRLVRVLIQTARRKRKLRLWVSPQLQKGYKSTFWEDTVPMLSELDFKKTFRLTRSTFYLLVDNVKTIEKNDTILRESIPVGKRVAISLTVLKGNVDFQTVASLYGVGKSTVFEILHEFTATISANLYEKTVSFPKIEEQEQIAKEYWNKWQFYNCIGAIDGTHLPIIAPMQYPQDYWCYKHFHSINLLAVTDHNYVIRYAYVGCPGRTNDASVLRNSLLFQKMQVESDGRYHIIGDAAFPLLPWLMKPYPIHLNMPPDEENYNFRLSKARMSIENVFGRLKGRWRILLKRCDITLPYFVNVVKACIVLHNLCEINKDTICPEWIPIENQQVGTVPLRSSQSRSREGLQAAKNKRDDLKSKLFRDNASFDQVPVNEI